MMILFHLQMMNILLTTLTAVPQEVVSVTMSTTWHSNAYTCTCIIIIVIIIIISIQ